MKYYSVTKYIDTFTPEYDAGTWFIDRNSAGTVDDPIQLPYVMLDGEVIKFVDDFYQSGIAVENYQEIMEAAGITNDNFDFLNLHRLNEKAVCAILTFIIRSDRFCEGYLKEKKEQGTVVRILKRLREIDEYNPYPDFHVDFVKGQKIAEVKTVMLADMGFPDDIPSKDTEYKNLDHKLVSKLEDEFIYLIEELLPRNLQDLFYKVGLEPCQAYWKIFEGTVRRFNIPRYEDHNDSNYGKFIDFAETGIENLWRKGYTFTEIYECTCVTKTMINDLYLDEIERALFNQKDYRYTHDYVVKKCLMIMLSHGLESLFF